MSEEGRDPQSPVSDEFRKFINTHALHPEQCVFFHLTRGETIPIQGVISDSSHHSGVRSSEIPASCDEG